MLVQGKRFRLTGPNTVRGLQVAVELAETYGAPQRDAPHSLAAMHGMSMAFPMQFDLAYASAPPIPGSAWARFPRMPVNPLVPAAPFGVQLIGPSNLKAPAVATEAVERYAQWRHDVARTDPEMPGLLPPVLNDIRVQSAYWSSAKRQRDGVAAVTARVVSSSHWTGSWSAGASISWSRMTQASTGARCAARWRGLCS